MSVKRNFRVTVEIVEWNPRDPCYGYATDKPDFHPGNGDWTQVYQQVFSDTIKLKAIEAALNEAFPK